jgi:inhibitor of cysteine peptidase
MSTITLTKTDKGKTITAHTGDVVMIRLPENPTTGYRWAIDQADETALAAQDATFAAVPGGATGSGGTRTFAFAVKRSGTVHLQLKLLRSWSGDSSIIERFDVTLQVKG